VVDVPREEAAESVGVEVGTESGVAPAKPMLQFSTGTLSRGYRPTTHVNSYAYRAGSETVKQRQEDGNPTETILTWTLTSNATTPMFAFHSMPVVVTGTLITTFTSSTAHGTGTRIAQTAGKPNNLSTNALGISADDPMPPPGESNVPRRTAIGLDPNVNDMLPLPFSTRT
jgi:hypothetical protein